MRVEINKKKMVEFTEIRVGDFFLAPNGHLCFKCDTYHEDDNTFDLNNEYFTTYEREQLVTRIDSSKIKIVVED